MRKIHLCAIAVLVACAVAGPAQVVSSFSNFSPGYTYTVGGGFTIGDGALGGSGGGPNNGGYSVGMTFVPGSTGFLDSILMGAMHCGTGSACGGSPPRDPNSNAVIMSLYDNSATGGGNLLESVTVTGKMLPWAEGGIVTGTSVLHPQLVAGIRYWLVATVPNIATDATVWGVSTNPQNSGSYTYLKVGTGPWAPYSSFQVAFQINVTQQLSTGCQVSLTQANQTIQNLQSEVAQLQSQLGALTTQNTQLQNQVSTLTAQNAQLQTQLNQVNSGVNSGLTQITSDFRTVFGNAAFSIPGATLLQQYQSLINAVLGLNRGRKQGVYENLGGH